MLFPAFFLSFGLLIALQVKRKVHPTNLILLGKHLTTHGNIVTGLPTNLILLGKHLTTQGNIVTGLPTTKDETSKTNLRNLHSFFFLCPIKNAD